MKKILGLSLILTVFDQIIKMFVTSQMSANQTIEVIGNFFNISYVRNYGAAWNIFMGNRFFLVFVAIMTIYLIYSFCIKNNKLNKLEIIVYSVLLGGIVGNLIDRVVFGYVIDYLDFTIYGYNFPVFNFADICIVLSVTVIIINIIRGEIYANNSK